MIPIAAFLYLVLSVSGFNGILDEATNRTCSILISLDLLRDSSITVGSWGVE